MAEVHVFVDTETTGFGHVANPPRDDAVVELGMAYRLNGDIEKIGWLCNPGKEYYANGRADGAFAVNQISIQEVELALPDTEVSKMANDLLDTLGEVVLHSYNIPFDKSFLEKYPWSFDKYQWGQDVMDIAHRFFDLPWDYKIGLKRTLERLGLQPIGEPHRAVTDAVSALLAAEEMSSHY